MMLLKQSTTITLRVGPFLDKADGVTEKTLITPVFEVSKAGGAFAARSSVTAVAHDSNGWYSVELNATDTGTLGIITVKSDDAATHLPVWVQGMVVPANVYDSLVGGTANLAVDATKWAGAATATDDVALATAPTNFAALSISAGGLVDITQGAADKVWASAARTLTSFGTLVADIWGALTSGLTTVGSIGKRLADNIDATVSSRHASGAAVASVTGAVGSVSADVNINMGQALPATPTAGTTGQALKDADTNLDATISSRLATASYTAPDNTSITAIKTKTDQLVFTSGAVDASVAGVKNNSAADALADAIGDRQMTIAAGVLTVKTADGLSTLYTKTVTTDAAAAHITALG